jgi:ankyrin repeat protein
MKNSEINTLLYASIYSSIVKKNIEYVKTLIDAGAKIDFSDENGVTAWFIAANSKLGGGDFELLEILLKNGTNINALNKNNNTVLDEAIIYNKDGRVAEFLLKNGAIIDFKKDGKKPLLVQATSDDNFEIVKLLLAYGANPNSRSDDGKTALISAAFNKNLRIIKELVKSGAEIVFSAAKDIKESITGVAGVVDENCTIISYEKNEREFNKPLDENGFKVSVKDTQLLKNLYFGEGNDTPKNNPLLPVELEITTLGISGVTVGKVIKVLDLPFQDPNGLLQVIEVNHTVTTSSWDTTIKFKYRPGN